jgi:gliding motility-associated-like protein
VKYLHGLLLSIILLPLVANTQCITRSANARCDTIIPTITCASGSPICFESVAVIRLSSRILVDTVCVSFGDGTDTTFAPPDTTFNITHYYHFTPDDSCPPWNNGEPGINCDIRANFFKRCPLGYSFNYSQTSVSFRFKPRADLNLQHAEYCTTDSALILDYGCTNSYLNTDYTDYWWDYGDGTADTVWNTDFSYFNSFPHRYIQPGNYVLALFAQNECGIDSDRVTIDTYTMTDVLLSTPSPICTGDTIRAHINGMGSSNFYLTEIQPATGAAQIINESTPDPAIIFSSAGSYHIYFHFGTCTIDTIITIEARVDLQQIHVADICDNFGNNPLVLSSYYTSSNGPVQSNRFWIRNRNGLVFSDFSSAFLGTTVNLPDTGWYVITDTSATICNTVHFRDSFNVIPRVVLSLPANAIVCLQTIYVLPTFPATSITLDGVTVVNDTVHIDTARRFEFVYQPVCGNSDTLIITGQGISIEAYDSFYCAQPGNITLTGSRPNMVFNGPFINPVLGIMHGDSSTVMLNPVYASYTDPGTGCVFRDTAIITIAPPLNVAYILSDTVCIFSTAQFVNYDSLLSCLINWGDGTIDSNTTHSYSSAGTKYVAITFADSVCSEIHGDSIVVVSMPVAFFSIAPDTICYGDTSFVAFSPSQYASTWAYGGLTTSNPPLLIDTSSVNQFLTVPVILSVSSAYCPVVNYTDYVYFNRAVLPVIALNYDSTCSPVAITIINNSALYPAASFQWYKNGALFSNSSALQQIDTLYADQLDSAYTFKLVIFSCNRYDSVSETVVVHQANFAPAIYADTFQSCVFDPFRFSASVIPNCIITYNFGDGSFTQPLPSDSTVAHAYDTAGDYTVSLTMYCSCKIKSDNLLVHVNAGPVISASVPSIGCTDSLITVTSQNTGVPAGAYTTYFGDGIYDLFAANPAHVYASTGTFNGWMTATGTNGCHSDTALFDVLIYKTPSADMPPVDTSACASVLTLFSVDTMMPNSTYEWSIIYNNQVTRVTTYDGTLPLYAEEPGEHFVFLTAYNNNHNSCVAYSDTFRVTVYPSPTASFSVGEPLVFNSAFSFPLHNMSAPAGNTYIWDFGDNTFSNEVNPTPHGYRLPGTYLIKLTARNGQCEDTTSRLLQVKPYLQLYVPNVFTPNNDGVNDFFEVFGNKQDLDYLYVKVYNRLGEKVFDSYDNNFKWDGTYKGLPLQPAVFVYTIETSGVSEDDIRLMKGSITLLR